MKSKRSAKPFQRSPDSLKNSEGSRTDLGQTLNARAQETVDRTPSVLGTRVHPGNLLRYHCAQVAPSLSALYAHVGRGALEKATAALPKIWVSNAVAQELTGHESASVSRQYTQIEQEVLRGAVSKLPDVLAGLEEAK
jgi:hypothetical protein